MLVEGYRVIEKIGQGGTATVYLAVQTSLNREVALKVLTHAGIPGFAKRFLREARMIASLNHPHVVTIYDIGVYKDRPYISMEYLTGGDLKAWISRGITTAKALDIVDKVASALQAAHEKGIIHRDVKPANVLFRRDGTPLLTDFGAAKQSDTSTLLTKTGAIVGTPAYLSPEHAHGIPLDGRADMYSLGIVLYEMLTGNRPYEGDSDISIIFKHAYEPLPMLPEEYRNLQPFLDKLLAKRREDRFENMAAMRSALRQLIRNPASEYQAPAHGTPIETGPESPEHSVQVEGTGFFRLFRYPAALAALAAVLAVVLVSYPEPADEPVVSVEPAATVDTQPAIPKKPPAATVDTQPAIPKKPPAQEAVKVEEVPAQVRAGNRLEVDELVQLGNERLAQNKTTSPEKDNAVYYFKLARDLDSGNAAARDGLYRVASQYVVLVEEQLRRRRYAQAERLVDQGLNIYPAHHRLRALDRRIRVERTSRKALRSLKNLADEVVDKIKETTNR